MNSRERFARIARRVLPFEHHFVKRMRLKRMRLKRTRLNTTRINTTRLKTTRLEALVLADEGGNAVEKSRLADHADEGNRKTCSARMIPNLSAIVQCAIGVGNRAFGKREQA